MTILNDYLKNQPVVYVTRDIERALGFDLDTQGYFIISNYSDFAKAICENKNNVLLIKAERQLDTWELLQLLSHSESQHHWDEESFEVYIGSKKIKLSEYKNQLFERFLSVSPADRNEPNILVFKNTPQIEKICQENNWPLLNPPAELSNKVEEKISQLDWLGDLKKYLPGYSVDMVKDIQFQNNKFIIQFNRSHTGSGTILIENQEQLNEIKNKFPERLARTAKYIDGPLFTNNNIVAKDNILIGNINYQITGLKPFTDLPFSTIGNDWGFTHKYLSKEQIKKYHQMVTNIGEKLRQDGWIGLFGVDIAIDDKTGELYLVEINCRQPASTTYESQLQSTKSYNLKATSYITTFEAHLMALLNLDLKDFELIPITTGSQIIQRVTKEIPSLPEPIVTRMLDFRWIKYNNTKLNTDLLRIQAPYSIMEKHNKLNKDGKELINFITVTRDNKTWDHLRGAVIIIRDNKILLMERLKYGLHYFLIPGGTMEKNETPLQTAIRETIEETGLKFEIESEIPIKVLNNTREEYYFFGKNISGEPRLGEEENNRNSKNNIYKLIWKNLDELNDINFIPEELKKYLIK